MKKVNTIGMAAMLVAWACLVAGSAAAQSVTLNSGINTGDFGSTESGDDATLNTPTASVGGLDFSVIYPQSFWLGLSAMPGAGCLYFREKSKGFLDGVYKRLNKSQDAIVEALVETGGNNVCVLATERKALWADFHQVLNRNGCTTDGSPMDDAAVWTGCERMLSSSEAIYNAAYAKASGETQALMTSLLDTAKDPTFTADNMRRRILYTQMATMPAVYENVNVIDVLNAMLDPNYQPTHPQEKPIVQSELEKLLTETRDAAVAAKEAAEETKEMVKDLSTWRLRLGAEGWFSWNPQHQMDGVMFHGVAGRLTWIPKVDGPMYLYMGPGMGWVRGNPDKDISEHSKAGDRRGFLWMIGVGARGFLTESEKFGFGLSVELDGFAGDSFAGSKSALNMIFKIKKNAEITVGPTGNYLHMYVPAGLNSSNVPVKWGNVFNVGVNVGFAWVFHRRPRSNLSRQ